MKVTIIGTNGMLSAALTKEFYLSGHWVDVYGLNEPIGYPYSKFFKQNLLEEKLDCLGIITSDLIVYASGAGVQAALNTDPLKMYALNVQVPIEITLQLKSSGYKGRFISFGSYMEIGLNNQVDKSFSESEIICSNLPVSNDYALSKRLYGRYINDLIADFTYWHFILPNMFSYDDIKPGTRLIPYVLNYLVNYNKGNILPKPAFSGGTQTRQYILMEEISEVIRLSIERELKSGVYNVGGGEFMSVRTLIERLFGAYNVPCDDSMFGTEIRRDGDIKSLKIDGHYLYQKIGYLPEKKVDDVFIP